MKTNIAGTLAKLAGIKRELPATRPEALDLIMAAERVLRADKDAQPVEYSLAMLALQRAAKEARGAESI